MTTGGEGGMVTTNDPQLWQTMWSYKDHGKTWEAVYERQHPPGPRLVHDNFGTNWRMMEIQAAIGLIQLDRIADWTRRRTEIAEMLAAMGRHPLLRVPEVPSSATHAWYRFYAFVRSDILTRDWNRDRMIEEISARGVPCFHGSASEIYLERAFENAGWQPKERLPIARMLGETSLCFLTHPTLTDDEIRKTIRVVDEVAALATR